MRTSSRPSNYHLRLYYRRQMIRLGITIASLLGLLLALSYFYKSQFQIGLQIIAEQFGIWGLILVTLVCDSIPSPVSPDFSLILIQQSHLSHFGWWYAVAIAATSYLAGHLSYWMGSFILSSGRLSRWLGESFQNKIVKQQKRVKKIGTILVLIGAITPFPMSLTCLAAGAAHLPYWLFSIATLTRIPRLLLFYLFLEQLL